MATISPTPISYGGGYISRGTVPRHQMRHVSPLTALTRSQGFTSNVEPLQNIDVGESSDDDMPQMPKLSGLAQAMLGQDGEHVKLHGRDNSRDYARDGLSDADVPHTYGHSPRQRIRAPDRAPNSRIRISRNNTPKHDSITPAPSVRVKRTALQGAPMRRNRRTPQGDEEQHPPSHDQENIPVSIVKPDNGRRSVLIHRDDSMMKLEALDRDILAVRDEKPIPLAQLSANTPLRPAPLPPPPPKMPELKTVADVERTSSKQKRRRVAFNINGKSYQQLDRLGKGGSGPVYRVMNESGKLLALKRVKLDEADANAVLGFKGEIDLLKKLSDEPRVVSLHDWQIDEEKQMLSILLEMGDTDLAHVIRSKVEAQAARLDLPFSRHYWKEMLECVAAVHAHDIVHSDLKPANFLVVQGRLKLIDFGIAGAIDVENTVNMHRDNLVGTPSYMSPESLQDSNVEARQEAMNASQNGQVPIPIAKLMRVGKPSDVWSLGCILYQLTYGRPPFAYIENQIHRVLAIVNEKVEIKYPTTGIGGVVIPGSLKRTLKACLDRNPANRPTIATLLADNDEWLYPEASTDLRMSEEMLGLVIRRVAERFWESHTKGTPTEDDVQSYARMFWDKLKERAGR